jgi:hypothetical protein
MTTTEAADYIRTLFANSITDTQFVVEESTPPAELVAALGNTPLAVKITGTWKDISSTATMLIHPSRTLKDENGPDSLAAAVLITSVEIIGRIKRMVLERSVSDAAKNN